MRIFKKIFVGILGHIRFCEASVADPDLGWVKNQDPGSGIRIWNEHTGTGSYFREKQKTIFWFKIFGFFDVDPDPGSF